MFTTMLENPGTRKQTTSPRTFGPSYIRHLLTPVISLPHPSQLWLSVLGSMLIAASLSSFLTGPFHTWLMSAPSPSPPASSSVFTNFDGAPFWAKLDVPLACAISLSQVASRLKRRTSEGKSTIHANTGVVAAHTLCRLGKSLSDQKSSSGVSRCLSARAKQQSADGSRLSPLRKVAR